MKLLLLGLVGVSLAQEGAVEPAPAAAAEDRIEEDADINDISAQDELPLIKDSSFCSADVKKYCSHKVAKDDYRKRVFIFVLYLVEKKTTKSAEVYKICRNFQSCGNSQNQQKIKKSAET